MTESSTSNYTFQAPSDEGEAALPAITSNSDAENQVDIADGIYTVEDEDDDANTERVHRISMTFFCERGGCIA